MEDSLWKKYSECVSVCVCVKSNSRRKPSVCVYEFCFKKSHLLFQKIGFCTIILLQMMKYFPLL